MRATPAFFATLLLVGCAVSSTIEKAETGKSEFDGAIYGGKTSSINTELPGVPKHRIFHQGSTGFISVETIRNSALERAEAFCAQSGASPYLIQETTSTPPHILGNWPRIEIIFSCVKNAKASPPAAPQDKYDRLSKLKALLDTGAITQQEYEAEKKKVLSE
ncbi:MAG: SHOCT domain-containing protein [Thiobacillus sp.]|nr:SHOCT domain-containing protein [Thiobacillus sp.]